MTSVGRGGGRRGPAVTAVGRGGGRRDPARATTGRGDGRRDPARATTGRGDGRRLRLDADPQDVGRGLGQLVVVVLELLREVLERQAIRRMEGGGLSATQVDDLGRALLEIRASLVQVRESLGLSAEEAESAVARAGRLLAADDDWAGPRTTAGPGGTPRRRGPREKARTAP